MWVIYTKGTRWMWSITLMLKYTDMFSKHICDALLIIHLSMSHTIYHYIDQYMTHHSSHTTITLYHVIDASD